MENMKIGDIVECTVTGIVDYGIFVKISDTYSGLIHKSEISYSYVVSPLDYVSMHERIRAEILNIDETKKHMILSIKNIRFHIDDEEKYLMHETKHGFKTLKSKLSSWEKEKLKEIENNN